MNTQIYILISIFALASCGTALADESKARPLSSDEITGVYFHDKQSGIIVLNADGTFLAVSNQRSVVGNRNYLAGTYTRDGATITLLEEAGLTTRGKLDAGTLRFPEKNDLLPGDSPWTKKAEGSDGEITGTYVNEKENASITLNANGTVSVEEHGRGVDGTYTRYGATILIQYYDTPHANFKVDKNALVAPDNSRWTRKEQVSGDEVTGTYVLENDFIKLNANGTFSAQDHDRTGTGIYTRDGATILLRTLKKDDWRIFTHVKAGGEDTLVFPGGIAFTKKAQSQE
jgi:hypothetical protein